MFVKTFLTSNVWNQKSGANNLKHVAWKTFYELQLLALPNINKGLTNMVKRSTLVKSKQQKIEFGLNLLQHNIDLP